MQTKVVIARILITAAVLTMGFMGASGQSSRKGEAALKFSELFSENSQRLEQQRAIIASAAKLRYGTVRLTRTKEDLPILQRLIDENVFNKSQTYELQSLGVTFGDVLVSEFPLRWVMVTDEYGTDPTLRFKQTTIQINALTMISKRIERGEPIRLQWLVDQTREQLAISEKKFR